MITVVLKTAINTCFAFLALAQLKSCFDGVGDKFQEMIYVSHLLKFSVTVRLLSNPASSIISMHCFLAKTRVSET